MLFEAWTSRARESIIANGNGLGKENGKPVWGDDLPLTDEVIRRHMEEESSPVTVGLYPILTDDHCWFLAIDFDKSTWQEDVSAFLKTCHTFQVPAVVERSRSGNGGHVWIFFQAAIPARTARQMGSALLTATLEQRKRSATKTRGSTPLLVRSC